jgi:hypothetical protein
MAPPEAAKMADASYMEEVAAEGGGAAPAEPGSVQYIAYSHSIGMRLPVKSIEPTMQAHVDACNKAGPAVCVVTNSWLNAYSETEANASLNLRATPAWIETFLAGVEAEAEAVKGDVTSRQTTAEDLTVTIIDTTPKETKMENLKDFLMIFLWTLLEDQVSGDPMSFSRLTEVTISEVKQDFELILPTAIIDILMTNPEGTYSTLNGTQVTYTFSRTTNASFHSNVRVGFFDIGTIPSSDNFGAANFNSAVGYTGELPAESQGSRRLRLRERPL